METICDVTMFINTVKLPPKKVESLKQQSCQVSCHLENSSRLCDLCGRKKHLFLRALSASWPGSISKNVSLRVACNLAKFHAFIIKVNNSLYFWSITAGLLTCFIVTNLIIDSVKFLDIYPRRVHPYNNLRETALK